MTNNEFMEAFVDDVHEARIVKLIWVAAAREREVNDFFEIFEAGDWAATFPQINQDIRFIEYCSEDEYYEILNQAGLYGFLAEIEIPNCDNFTFKDGKPVSWSSHHGMCRIAYAYAETTDLLYEKIKAMADAFFIECYTTEAKKTKKPKK